MIELYVAGQSMKMFTPVIAADSLNYLTAKVYFVGEEWTGYTRWAHFRKGETVYDVSLDENDMVTEADALNLTTGEWEVYITGTKDSARLTTVVVIFTVKESGLVDAPLHVIPQTVAEQIDAKASQALLVAQGIKEKADNGDFNGKSFKVNGFYDTVEALSSAVTEPLAGDAYGVGEVAPYDIYIWDGTNNTWVNNGNLQGAQGEEGQPGVTFTPHVDASGNLSWTNDGGLENPTTQNIRGETGATGATGPEGKTAYAAAQEAGYTGTETTFYMALTYMPYHNARHLPDGADPITVKTANIENSAVNTDKIANSSVTKAKLAANATHSSATGTLTVAGWTTDEESEITTQTISVQGVTATNTVIVAPAPASLTAYGEAAVYCSAQADGTLTFICEDVPEVALTVNVIILV